MLQPVSGFKHTVLALSLALQLFPTVRASDPAPQARHEREPKNLDAIEVHATPLPDTAERLTTPVEVLAGNTLEDAKAGTLGETVAVFGVENSRIWREVTALGNELKEFGVVAKGAVEARAGILVDWKSWWALEQDAKASTDLHCLEQV